MTPHPGYICFEDADQGSSRSKPVESVPESIAWAVLDGQRVPVVRVVASMRGQQRVLRSYGVGGELLSSTVQRRR